MSSYGQPMGKGTTMQSLTLPSPAFGGYLGAHPHFTPTYGGGIRVCCATPAPGLEVPVGIVRQPREPVPEETLPGEAARLLGVSRDTIRYRMQRYGMAQPRFGVPARGATRLLRKRKFPSLPSLRSRKRHPYRGRCSTVPRATRRSKVTPMPRKPTSTTAPTNTAMVRVISRIRIFLSPMCGGSTGRCIGITRYMPRGNP